MDRIELQRKLYDARNAYLKHQAEMVFQKNEIKFLNHCIELLNTSKEDPLSFDSLFS
jgi:hypothetical protein